MLERELIVVRGGGDMATAVVHRLWRAGFRVLVLECEKPSAINLDGEIRFAQDVEMKLADEKIRFFYPKGLTWKHT